MHLKTSDFSICAEVSQSTIRDYSDQGLLGPVMRSKSSSYRSFDPQQIPQIYLIKTLREMGYTPQQIRTYGKNRSPETAVRMFSDCSARLSEEIAELQKKLDQIQSHVSFIEEGQSSRQGEIEMRNLDARAIRYSSLGNHNGNVKELDRLRRAHAQIRLNGNAGCPTGLAYNNFFDLLENPGQPAQLVSYDPSGPEIRPAGKYLVGTVNCYYSQKTSLAHRMYSFALQNNLEFVGPAFSVYLLDAVSVIKQEQYLLQIAVEIKQLEKPEGI